MMGERARGVGMPRRPHRGMAIAAAAAHPSAMPHPPRPARTAAPVLVLLAACAAAPARAQRVEAPLVLRLPTSARTLAQGGGQPVAQDAEALLGGPALLAWSRGASVQLERVGDAATLGVLASALPALGGTLGTAVQYLDYGASAGRFPAAAAGAVGRLPTRGPLDAASVAATVGYARALFGMRTGLAVRFAEERLGASRDGTLTADVGVARGFLGDNVVVSLAAQHLGAGVRLGGTRAPLPARLTAGFAGAGYPLRSWLDVGGSWAVSVLRGGGVVTGGGAEAALVPIDGYAIALRAGVRRGDDPDDRGVTAGLGLTRDRVSVDYAYHPVGGRSAHRVGLRLR